jgi:hypothetical protein
MKLVAVLPQGLLADLIRRVISETGAPSRSITIMLMKISGLEKKVINPWMTHLVPVY